MVLPSRKTLSSLKISNPASLSSLVKMSTAAKPSWSDYLSVVSDDEWEFCSPYLTLTQEALQREYTMRSLFNAERGSSRAMNQIANLSEKRSEHVTCFLTINRHLSRNTCRQFNFSNGG